MKYLKVKNINPIAVIGKERSLIANNYDYIECIIQGSVLFCYGEYQPTTESEIYKYRIKYNPKSRPVVHIKSHEISYNDDIHMYPKDNSLCLYHKTDLAWDTSYNLYDTIIPWTHEWIVFYELYLITGEWLHPFVPHKRNDKI